MRLLACGTSGEKTDACRILIGKPEGKDNLEDPGLERRIILKWIFRKWNGGMD
jgi:hypothetical protein